MYSFFQRLSSKQQRILITVSLSVLIITIGLIAIPAARAILYRHSEIQSALELIERQYQEAQKSKRTLRELASVLERILPFEQAYLQKEYERQFITDLETLAAAHNVTQTFSIEATKPPATIRGDAYVISMQVQGTYADLLTYLHTIQRLPTTISIKTVTFSRAKQTGHKPKIRTNTCRLSFLV